jgi:hypothetical protein
MTEEELNRAMREHAAMMNVAPKPSLERRLDWLEADASAQRTAILRLEKRIMWLSFVMGAVFAALGIGRMFL